MFFNTHFGDFFNIDGMSKPGQKSIGYVANFIFLIIFQ